MSITKEQIDQIGKLSILDENGRDIVFSSVWKEHKTVLVFVRHFG